MLLPTWTYAYNTVSQFLFTIQSVNFCLQYSQSISPSLPQDWRRAPECPCLSRPCSLRLWMSAGNKWEWSSTRTANNHPSLATRPWSIWPVPQGLDMNRAVCSRREGSSPECTMIPSRLSPIELAPDVRQIWTRWWQGSMSWLVGYCELLRLTGWIKSAKVRYSEVYDWWVQ